MAENGSGMKILAAVAVCAIVAVAAFVAYNTMGGGTSSDRTPDPSNYIEASIPTVPEASDIDIGKCYAPGIDGDGQEFRDLVASEEYRSRAGQIIKDSQQQIEELRARLNAEVAAKIQSVDAIQDASGYKEDGIFMGSGIERLIDKNNMPTESLGSYYMRCLNYYENEQTVCKQNIEKYFQENVQDYTKSLYAKYNIDLTYEHFKSVVDYLHHDASVELVKVDDDREVKAYEIIGGNKYEYIITPRNENLPESTDLDFLYEFCPISIENNYLKLYDDIHFSDYYHEAYDDYSGVNNFQKRLNAYCDELGEPYASQVKGIKEEIDAMQNDYVKQVEQIVDSGLKKIAGIQADALKDA